MAPESSEIQQNPNPGEPPPEVHKDASSEDIATNKASQDGHKKPEERVHEEGSPEGMTTDETAKDEDQNGSSKDGATLAEDFYRRMEEMLRRLKNEAEVVHEDKKGSSKDMTTPLEDLDRWAEEKERQLEVKVSAYAVVHKNCRTLFKTALKGDWKTIKKTLTEEPASITAAVITAKGLTTFTVLDVAIMAGRDELVEKLLQRFPPEDEDFDDRRIILAAKRGRIRMVKALVSKIEDDSEITGEALVEALTLGPTQKELTWYLARRMAADHVMIGNLIMADHMDVALFLARKRYHAPGLLKLDLKNNNVSYLDILAVMPRYFRSGARLNFWERSIYKCIPLYLIDTTFDDSKDNRTARALRALNCIKTSVWNFAIKAVPFIKRIGELKLRHHSSLEFAKLLHYKMKDEMTTPEILEYLLTSGAILNAASCGVLEIVDLYLKYFPELMWEADFTRKLTTKIVKGRHAELFRLVNTHNIAQYYWSTDVVDVELLEAVNEWPSGGEFPNVSGAAFLLQRELQWFRIIDVGGFPSLKWAKFLEDKKSCWKDFVDKRKELFKDARDWMKDTSSSCSLVATLIITIAFAAAFTVPGGNNGSTGIAIFLGNSSFLVFAIADTLALIFSVSATMMFLAILTSRYEIEDFLVSLPRKIIFGLTFLFLSLIFMLVAFGSVLTIVLKERLKWIYIPITLLAAFPVALFTILQLPLYIEMIKSTFWPQLYRPLKPWNDLDTTQSFRYRNSQRLKDSSVRSPKRPSP